MRIASWLLVACAALAAIGLFFPAIEANGGGRLTHRAKLSLADAAADRALARRMLAVYHASHGQRVGMQLIAAMEPHAGGRLRDALDDAHDAMDTLGSISDDDAKTLGTGLAAAIWIFFAIQIVMGGLVFVQAVAGQYRRGRLIGGLVLAIASAVIGGGLAYACKDVAFEINDEVSVAIARVGAGAWMIGIGALGALAAAIAMLVISRGDGLSTARREISSPSS